MTQLTHKLILIRPLTTDDDDAGDAGDALICCHSLALHSTNRTYQKSKPKTPLRPGELGRQGKARGRRKGQAQQQPAIHPQPCMGSTSLLVFSTVQYLQRVGFAGLLWAIADLHLSQGDLNGDGTLETLTGEVPQHIPSVTTALQH